MSHLRIVPVTAEPSAWLTGELGLWIFYRTERNQFKVHFHLAEGTGRCDKSICRLVHALDSEDVGEDIRERRANPFVCRSCLYKYMDLP